MTSSSFSLSLNIYNITALRDLIRQANSKAKSEDAKSILVRAGTIAWMHRNSQLDVGVNTFFKFLVEYLNIPDIDACCGEINKLIGEFADGTDLLNFVNLEINTNKSHVDMAKQVLESRTIFEVKHDEKFFTAKCRELFTEGVKHYDKSETDEAFYSFRNGANSGCRRSSLCLAVMYHKSNLSDKNKLAFKWMLKAAELGAKEAQVVVGSNHLHGIDIDQDFLEAFYWFKRAEAQGSNWGMFFLGTLYQYGVGVNKNDQKASKFYGKAIENGLLFAKEQLYSINQNK